MYARILWELRVNIYVHMYVCDLLNIKTQNRHVCVYVYI